MQNSSMPLFNFSVGTHNENLTSTQDAYKGEVKVFNLDITIMPDSRNNLLVKFLTPVNESGVMEICNVNVVYVGRNLPCVTREMLEATFENRCRDKS